MGTSTKKIILPNSFILGDAKKVCRYIPDESVDLIFTDPYYGTFEDYRFLAKLAKRVLKPNKPILVFGSNNYIEVYKRIFKGLDFNYAWTLNYVVQAKTSRLLLQNVFTWLTPCLWFNKGKFAPYNRIPDTFISSEPPTGIHVYNKNVAVLKYWMSAFTKEEDVVLDIFSGSAPVLQAATMLNRKYIGIEQDSKVYSLGETYLQQSYPSLLETSLELQSIF